MPFFRNLTIIQRLGFRVNMLVPVWFQIAVHLIILTMVGQVQTTPVTLEVFIVFFAPALQETVCA